MGDRRYQGASQVCRQRRPTANNASVKSVLEGFERQLAGGRRNETSCAWPISTCTRRQATRSLLVSFVSLVSGCMHTVWTPLGTFSKRGMSFIATRPGRWTGARRPEPAGTFEPDTRNRGSSSESGATTSAQTIARTRTAGQPAHEAKCRRHRLAGDSAVPPERDASGR